MSQLDALNLILPNALSDMKLSRFYLREEYTQWRAKGSYKKYYNNILSQYEEENKILMQVLTVERRVYRVRFLKNYIRHHNILQTPNVDSSSKIINKNKNWLKFYFNPFTPLKRKQSIYPILKLNKSNILKMYKYPNLKWPLYDRSPSHVSNYIVHIGVGNFHRAHQAVYTNQCNQEDSKIWGICGIGLMPWDKKMYETLKSQNYLYTLLLRSEMGTEAHIIGSIVKYIYAVETPKKAIDQLLDPKTKIVSLTVTEKGYFQNNQETLDLQAPAIQNDLKNPSSMNTCFGLLYISLKKRKEEKLDGFTILSCDNITCNGDVLKKLLYQFIEKLDKTLIQWLDKHVTFPNTMVDRITPSTSSEHKEIIQDQFRILDDWPVVCEHFSQWVIEDNFLYDRPPWEKYDVLFVSDVKAYEHMKLRLLNGTHSALCFVSLLLEYEYIDEALQNEFIYNYSDGYLTNVIVTLDDIPGVNIQEYKYKLLKRFQNPFIKDKLIRLAEDSSKKIYTTMHQVILDLINMQQKTLYVSFALACFIKLMATPNDITDPQKEILHPLCKNSISNYDVRPVLKILFGSSIDLIADEISNILEKIMNQDVSSFSFSSFP